MHLTAILNLSFDNSSLVYFYTHAFASLCIVPTDILRKPYWLQYCLVYNSLKNSFINNRLIFIKTCINFRARIYGNKYILRHTSTNIKQNQAVLEHVKFLKHKLRLPRMLPFIAIYCTNNPSCGKCALGYCVNMMADGCSRRSTGVWTNRCLLCRRIIVLAECLLLWDFIGAMHICTRDIYGDCIGTTSTSYCIELTCIFWYVT